jgi:hypothetical protein
MAILPGQRGGHEQGKASLRGPSPRSLGNSQLEGGCRCDREHAGVVLLPGQRPVLAFVSNTTVRFTDMTNPMMEAIPGTFSRCFIDSGLGLCP